MRNAPNRPSHIVLVGPMGAGKSSIGRLLAARLHDVFIDLDASIEAEAGTTISALFNSEGEAGFRLRESRALTSALMTPEASVIATGGGAVLDDANRCAMRDAGIVIYLQVEPALQLRRLTGDLTRPLLATVNPTHRLAELQAMREPLYRAVADMVFDTTPHSPDAAACALLELLAHTSEQCA